MSIINSQLNSGNHLPIEQSTSAEMSATNQGKLIKSIDPSGEILKKLYQIVANIPNADVTRSQKPDNSQ